MLLAISSSREAELEQFDALFASARAPHGSLAASAWRALCRGPLKGSMAAYFESETDFARQLAGFAPNRKFEAAASSASGAGDDTRPGEGAATGDGAGGYDGAEPGGGTGDGDGAGAHGLGESGSNWAALLQQGDGAADEELDEVGGMGGGMGSPGGGRVKRMSAASLAAALELTDLESAQQRFGGGAFLPILPLGSDTDSVDRGLPTLPTSTARWPTSL